MVHEVGVGIIFSIRRSKNKIEAVVDTCRHYLWYLDDDDDDDDDNDDDDDDDVDDDDDHVDDDDDDVNDDDDDDEVTFPVMGMLVNTGF